jgi:hypothetical protein
MSEMVERVAKAILLEPTKHEIPVNKAFGCARAAITAMRQYIADNVGEYEGVVAAIDEALK